MDNPIQPANLEDEMDQRLVRGIPLRTVPGDKEKPPPDPITEALEMKKKAVASTIIGSIPEQHAPTSKSEDSIVAASLKTMGDIIKTSLEQITSLQRTAPTTEKSDFYKDLLTKLLEAQSVSKNVQDPWDAYTKAATIMEGITDKLAKQILPQAPSPGAVDPTKLLEVEKIKAEIDQRRILHEKEMEELRHRWHQEDQRFETERAERERRWKQEDEKWKIEMEIKAAEIAGDQKRKQELQGQLGELIGGIVQGVHTEPDYHGAPATVASRAEDQLADQFEPTKFPCHQCGKDVDVPPGAEEVICDKAKGGCGMVFKRR